MAKYGGLNNTLYVLELFNTTGIVATTGEKQTLIDGLINGKAESLQWRSLPGGDGEVVYPVA